MTSTDTRSETPRPQDFAQLIRMGRGWAIGRNSATLAVTDYEHIGNEIVAALNNGVAQAHMLVEQSATIAELREALASLQGRLDRCRELAVRSRDLLAKIHTVFIREPS